MTISRADFCYLVRPTPDDPERGRIHAVEMIPSGSAWSRYTLCGVEWEPEWEDLPVGRVGKRLCGTCDKGIRRRIREAEATIAIEVLRARVGESATTTVEGLLAEVNRTIGGVEVAKAGLEYCLTCLDEVRKELIVLMGGHTSQEGASPTPE